MQNIILVTALAFATAACSATGTATVTHAWNAEDKTTAEYRLDNFSCLDRANKTESDLVLNDSRFLQLQELHVEAWLCFAHLLIRCNVSRLLATYI